MTADFRVLGRLEVDHDDGPVRLGRRRERCLLGILLLEAGELVSVDRLLDLLWDGEPSATARANVHTHVSRIRGRLEPLGVRLRSSAGSYAAEVDRDTVDAHRFRQLVADARTVADPSARVDVLQRALDQWRGPLLEGDASDRLRDRVGADLVELRLSATELLAEAKLVTNRERELIGELTVAITEHPYREPLVGHLMRALYQAGRPAEALEAYERCRGRLADELGVDPGPDLQRLHTAVLRRNLRPIADAPHPTARPTVPRQLPPDIATFTGRAGALRGLDQLLDRSQGAVATITGIGGVGKTALAVHWGHRVIDRFPAGQLYMDLRGYSTDSPLDPVEALARFIFALGGAAPAGPTDTDTLSATYRSLLADRRMLIVLDNAADSEQVRPLLAGSPGTAVIVTSRTDLGGLVALDDAHPLSLDPFTPDESATLLTRLLGAKRVGSQSAAAAELADLCGHLPLALRIAAANLGNTPHRELANAADRLRSPDRIATLAVGSDPRAAIRSVFDHSYVRLPAEVARLFRLVAIVPGEDVTEHAVAALADVSLPQAQSLLDALVVAHLLQPNGAGRFAMHDLVRRYACERADDEDDPQAAALDRLLAFYLHTVDAAANTAYPEVARRLRPDSAQARGSLPRMDTRAEALSWLDAEHRNIVAAVQRAARSGRYLVVCRLIDALRGYCALRRSASDWTSCFLAGLAAASSAGDADAQAAMHACVASSYLNVGDYDPAVHHLIAARTLYRTLEVGEGEAAALGNLAAVAGIRGEIRRSIEYATEALYVYRSTGSRRGEAITLGNLGQAHEDLGQLNAAARDFARSLELCQELGDREREANMRHALGIVDHALGRIDPAEQSIERALRIFRDLGTRWGEASTLDSLARLHCDMGRADDACDEARAAVALARDVSDRRTEADALNGLATAARCCGRIEVAGGDFTTALRLARDIGHRHAEIDALLGLAAIGGDREAFDDAIAAATTALSLAREAGYRVLEGRAFTALADGHLKAGDAGTAIEYCREAMAVHSETEYLLGKLRTLEVLARALRADDPSAAEVAWQEAQTLARDLGASTCLNGRNAGIGVA